MTLSVADSTAEIEGLSASREGWKPIQVTICGGGNGAHVAAGFLASRGIRYRRRGVSKCWARGKVAEIDCSCGAGFEIRF